MGSVFIPYVATSLSVISRFVFMLMIYRNKSTKSLSLVMCFLSISSSCMWISYSIENNDVPLIVRSSLEIPLQTISAIYIIRNKVIQYYSEKKISSIPTPLSLLSGNQSEGGVRVATSSQMKTSFSRTAGSPIMQLSQGQTTANTLTCHPVVGA